MFSRLGTCLPPYQLSRPTIIYGVEEKCVCTTFKLIITTSSMFILYKNIIMERGVHISIVDTRHYIMAAGSTSRESAGFLPTGMTMGNSIVRRQYSVMI